MNLNILFPWGFPPSISSLDGTPCATALAPRVMMNKLQVGVHWETQVEPGAFLNPPPKRSNPATPPQSCWHKAGQTPPRTIR